VSNNEKENRVEAKVHKPSQNNGVLVWIRQNGPSTEAEIVYGMKPRSINATRSEIYRVHRNHQLYRIVAIEKRGPVWLYFMPEEERALIEMKREVWVPLRRLEEYKMTLIHELLKEQKRKWITLNMVANRAGYPPSEIERETYRVAKELGIDVINALHALEHYKDITLGLLRIVNVGRYLMTGEPLPRDDLLEYALQHVVTGFPKLCDRKNFRDKLSPLVKNPINFEKLESICEGCGRLQNSDKRKAKKLFKRYYRQ
jgi:hypothetical protein